MALTDTSDPLAYTCTVCSATPGTPCRQRVTFAECAPHLGRLALAGVLYNDE